MPPRSRWRDPLGAFLGVIFVLFIDVPEVHSRPCIRSVMVPAPFASSYHDWCRNRLNPIRFQNNPSVNVHVLSYQAYTSPSRLTTEITVTLLSATGEILISVILR